MILQKSNLNKQMLPKTKGSLVYVRSRLHSKAASASSRYILRQSVNSSQQ